MSRLIDADAITFRKAFGDMNEDPMRFVTEKEVKRMPTIDAVPVVRCRDCINWAGDPAKKPEYAGCWRYGAAHGIIVHENGFCDKGMRRTGL